MLAQPYHTIVPGHTCLHQQYARYIELIGSELKALTTATVAAFLRHKEATAMKPTLQLSLPNTDLTKR
jgi:hypothetical protein